jgi:hypothetical protein
VLPERPVRPRTRAGRLASLDAWLVAECALLLDGRGNLVDFGFGLSPITTQQWAESARGLNPGLRVLGVEQAEHSPAEGVELVKGDFSSCAVLGPTSVLRAMNVLRGYREEEVDAIHTALGAGVVEGGLVIEGSTDTEGHVTVAWLLRKNRAALVREALLFHTDFSRGFSPWLFRDWLPRDVRRRTTPGTRMHAMLSAWDARCSTTSTTPSERFLSSLGGEVQATEWERTNGFARWVSGGD